MNTQNWKIYDKSGSPLNWTQSALIDVIFESPTGKNAEGFLITDPVGVITSAEIINGGFGYNNDVSIFYSYSLEDTINILSGTILYNDVSIFNPEPANVSSISNIINIDASGFVYPSVTYAAAIFLNPVSQGLVETEHLFIFEETSTGYIRPHDASEHIIVMEFIGDDDEIQFFEVNEESKEIIWSNAIAFDVSIFIENTPLQINIGFRAETEGIFERILRIYHLVDDTLYTMADIVVNAESIGEDERFRTLIANFGLPDPKDIPQIFKETDINEDLPDWEVLNYKSKHIILEHDKIMPYIGSYKALINAIKWLGYDDIFVREWFLNVKENKKLSFIVPFDAKDRAQTILMFNSEQRKVLKKLNQLTLNYCLSRETGELDVWGTPLTENCYSYNIKEIFIKLLGLKQWLERHIIGVNCRITDITGEGVYFERIQNLIYATGNIGNEYDFSQTLTPYGIDGNSELVYGDASIRLSFLEMSRTTINDLPYRFIDMATSAWNPNDPSVFYSFEDPSYLSNPDLFLHVGATFGYPFKNISDILYRLSTEKEVAGVITDNLVTNPLFVYNNTLRFYEILDSSSVFYDVSTNLTVLLEKAYLRDPSIDEWTNSIAYSIYPDPSNNYDFIMESSEGYITYFNGYATFRHESGSRLEYSIDDNYHVPLLKFNGFKYTDASGINSIMGNYFLDIIDGKIYMNGGMMNIKNSSDNVELYLNFHYDTSLNEQMITLNPIYTSPRIMLYQVDPSIYYWSDPSNLSGGNNSNIYVVDNSVYTMYVNHIGDYNIEMFGWDSWNTAYFNIAKKLYPVWIKYPTLFMLLNKESKNATIDLKDINIILDNNLFPIYDRSIPLQGLRLEFDDNSEPYVVVPSITFLQSLPEENSINKFFNLTERVTDISGTIITVDKDYQEFYADDIIRLIKFNKNNYFFVEEVSSYIVAGSNPYELDQIPASFSNSTDYQIYVLNDTLRNTINVQNIDNQLILTIPTYRFLENQLVGIIVEDNITGYTWGASYRVIDVSGYEHTFESELPQHFIDGSTRYTIKAKHAFSSFSTFSIPTDSATEENNEFKIYLKDSYCQEYYLDNTFIYMNILFDQERINDAWYNPYTKTNIFNYSLFSCGRNQYGQLGLGDNVDRNILTKVGKDKDWINSTAGSYSSVGIKKNGTIWSWGWNLYGQLGQEDNIDRNIPTQIGNDEDWVHISTRDHHTLAIKEDGTLWSCGLNNKGQLGLGDNTSRNMLTQVGTDTDWVKAFVGFFHTVAIKSNGTLWTCGHNLYGELGLGDNTDRNTLTQVGTDTDWNKIAIGAYFIAAIKEDGTLWTWGRNNSGQLGLSDNTNRNLPTQVGVDLDWILVSCGETHMHLLKSDYTLWATGYNFQGQLGLEDNTDRNTLTQIGTENDWRNISCGDFHTHAIKIDGTLWATGWNLYGQLGLGDNTNKNLFTHVGTDTDWIDVEGGYVLTHAIKGEPFYHYKHYINTDTGSLVIIRSIYENDPTKYMINQKNIFTSRFNKNNSVYFRVFNESVPIIFNETDLFNVIAESYDKYGNLAKSEKGFIQTDPSAWISHPLYMVDEFKIFDVHFDNPFE